MSEFLRVYKFYGPERALDNLRQQRLKISTLSDLNDPFEFRSFKFPTKGMRKIWEQTRASLFDGKGIICFSENWENPVIWSHYAENHRGLALGFDIPAGDLLKVSYQKRRDELPFLSELPSSELFPLISKSLSTKFQHWEYEQEYRAFAGADDICPDTGLYFKDFGPDLVLREIVIGAEANITSEEILELSDAKEVEIITSRLAFKTYRVVRQKNPKKWK